MKPCRKKFVLSRVFALLALAAGTIVFSIPVRTGRFDLSDGEISLEKRADAYLCQTARILGDRFNEEFYRSVVRTESEKAEKPDGRLGGGACECFACLAPETDRNVAEALAFLDEVGEEEITLPFPGHPYRTAGNPIDAAADWLAPPPLVSLFSFGNLRTGAAYPVSAVFHFCLAAVSISVSAFFPVFLYGSVLCMGMLEIEETLRRAVRFFSVSDVISGSGFRKTRKEHRVSSRPAFSDEKMTVVLQL